MKLTYLIFNTHSRSITGTTTCADPITRIRPPEVIAGIQTRIDSRLIKYGDLSTPAQPRQRKR